MQISADMMTYDSHSIAQSSEMLSDVLQMAAAESTEVAGDLIAMNAEQRIDINQLESMGNAVDTYA